MKIFSEILSDYVDPTTGDTSIGGYFYNQDDGVAVAWVSPDGKFRIGDHSKPEYLLCDLVQETLNTVIREKLTKASESARVAAPANVTLIDSQIDFASNLELLIRNGNSINLSKPDHEIVDAIAQSLCSLKLFLQIQDRK